MNRTESLIRTAGLGLLEFLLSGYKISVEGRENIDQYNQYSHCPSIIYFNHNALIDPVIITLLMKNEFSNRLGNLVVFPVAESYLNPEMEAKKLPIYRIGVELAEKIGKFKMVPIVQSYRLRDETLTEKERNELVKLSSELAKDYIRHLNQWLLNRATVIIAPEGTRGQGALQPAEAGIGFLVKKLSVFKRQQAIAEAVVLPVGLVYQGGQNNRTKISLNPIRPREVKVIVGRPLSLEDISQGVKELEEQYVISPNSSRLLSDYLMTKLRDILPESMWGVYHPDLLLETMTGRFEIRINPNTGKSSVFDIKNNQFI